jgi:mitochondrial import inner membrane translocase subunit TIM54
MKSGKRHGDITEQIADEVRSRRRIMAGLDPLPQGPVPLATNRTPEERRARELSGGIVLVGRVTMKEFFAGLSRGWTEGLRKVDKEAALAHALEEDGAFDEPEEPSPSGDLDGEPIPTPSKLPPGGTVPIFSPLQAQMRAMDPKPSPSTKVEEPAIPSRLDVPPATIPELPPLLLVEHTNRIGLSQIPIMLWEWFNERKRVQAGAEAAYRLVQGVTRPFTAPPPAEFEELSKASAEPVEDGSAPKPAVPETDLDFDRAGESVYKRSLSKWPAEVEKARKEYYDTLPAKLATARALARRTREPTKEEETHPPPTEMELRQERMKKEQRWRSDMAGWDIIRPDVPVTWDERFRNALRVFVDPPQEDGDKRETTT